MSYEQAVERVQGAFAARGDWPPDAYAYLAKREVCGGTSEISRVVPGRLRPLQMVVAKLREAVAPDLFELYLEAMKARQAALDELLRAGLGPVKMLMPVTAFASLGKYAEAVAQRMRDLTALGCQIGFLADNPDIGKSVLVSVFLHTVPGRYQAGYVQYADGHNPHEEVVLVTSSVIELAAMHEQYWKGALPFGPGLQRALALA